MLQSANDKLTEKQPMPNSVIPRLTRDLQSTKDGFKAGRWRVIARHDKNRRKSPSSFLPLSIVLFFKGIGTINNNITSLFPL